MRDFGLYPVLAAEEYHKEREFIGSSTLITMDESPKHFQHAWKGPAKDPSAAMIKGTMLHSLLLEQDIANYIGRPLTEKGSLVASNTTQYKEFLAANPGKIPVHPDDISEMETMLNAFCENKRAMAMLKDAKIEHSVFTKDPSTGILMKARPDIWLPGGIIDLKSTTDIRKFENQIFRDMYDVRLVHYGKALEFQTGEKIKEYYFIAYGQSAPYCSKIFKLRPSDIEKAESKWRILMNQVSVCMKGDIWPGYDDAIQLVTRPRYFEEETITFDEVG